jgi:hypothetical protein
MAKKKVLEKMKNVHEKMFTSPGHKGNANQNHTKVPPHHQQQMLARMQGKRNPHTLLVGM